MALLNRTRMTTATTGTGTVTLGSADTGYLSFAEAGAVNATVYSYVLEDGDDFEIGIGTYTSSGTTFSRDTVTVSKIGGTAGTTKLTLSGTAKIAISPRSQDLRERLTANRTFAIPGDYATWALAWAAALNLDFNGFTLTIDFADNTYTAPIVLDRAWVGGPLIVQGNTTTPANCIISTTSADAIAVGGFALPAPLTIRGFKVQTTTAGYGANLYAPGPITLTNMDFGAVASGYDHVIVTAGCSATLSGDYTISGGAARHWNAATQGIIVCFGNTITLSGTPAFTSAFADASGSGALTAFSNTFSGSATGKRFSVSGGAVINALGAVRTYFPGDAAGVEIDGGKYLGASTVPMGAHFAMLIADRTLTSTTSQQAIFDAANDTFTLEAGTTYFFEAFLHVSGMSATSGNFTFSLIGAGTATFSACKWFAQGLDSSTPTTAAAIGGSLSTSSTGAGDISTAAVGTAWAGTIKGKFRVNAAGTIIPSIGLTTATAATMEDLTTIQLTPVGGSSVQAMGPAA